MKPCAVITAALFVGLLSGQTPPAPERPTLPKFTDVNEQILELVIQDQWDRGVDMFGGRNIAPPPRPDGVSIPRRDEERQEAARKLLAEGKVQSGRDYFFAALIFQHSTKSEGLILAHALATTAALKGNSSARWMAAASFDRYLWTLKQPQVFGTQFHRGEGGGPLTMEPYDRAVIPDALRAAWCVVPLDEQQKIAAEAQSGKPVRATSAPDCR